MPTWARPRARTLLGAGTALALVVATTTALTVTPAGRDWACDQLDLGCPPPFRIAVQADPGSVGPSDTDAPGTASYVFSGETRDLGPPPDGREDCRGWAAWAASIGAASAGATPLRLDVAATGQDQVRVVGFTLRVGEDIKSPSADASPARLSLTCTTSPDAERPTARQPGTERPTSEQPTEVIPAEVTTLDLDSRLITSQDPVVATSGEQALPIAPGITTSFAVTTTTSTCDCRWRVEVELLVGDERQVVTVGPDGARPGTAADNPDQPSFETTTADYTGLPVHYVAGRWQYDRGNEPTTSYPYPSTPVCPLASTSEVIAALDSVGVTARSTTRFSAGANQDTDDPGTRETAVCSWRLPSASTDLGAVILVGATTVDEAAARTVFAAWKQAFSFSDAIVDQCGFLSSNPPVGLAAVGDVGDEAAGNPGWLVARAGNRIVRASVCAPAGGDGDPARAPAAPGDLAGLRMVTQAVLGSTW
ncbi:hypothetical protein BCD48_12330 [Pseudofrankia sp. BMG5.36]|nr:hypothetical protein BCD48_12330 [Pseudofrankia sp. BMG5.36]